MPVVTRQMTLKWGRGELTGFPFPFQHTEGEPSLSPWEQHKYIRMCVFYMNRFRLLKKKKPLTLYIQNSFYV